MYNFYTNVTVWGGKILFRGVENGRRVKTRVEYYPSLFVPSQTPTPYKTLHGEYVGRVQPGTIKDCKEFVNQYDDVQGFTIYGNQRYEYCYIADNYPDHIDFDMSLIKIANLDIEAGKNADGEYAKPDVADAPVTAITVKMDGTFYAFCTKDFTPKQDNVVFYKCASEMDLLKKFVNWWSSDHPDIITGWNVEEYDIPYLCNRIIKVLGEPEAKKLSPWNWISGRMKEISPDRWSQIWSILGISTIDYLKLFKWYAPTGKSQEDYKLDTVAHEELGTRKVSFEEYGNLERLFEENPQLFMEYNIKDVDLVDQLDAKHNLMSMAMTLCFTNKHNFEDVFAQTRMWDAICFNRLKKKKMVCPPIIKHTKDSAYVGAYVKETINGMHKWVASFDVNSEYPSVIMGSNIGPETIVEPQDYTPEMHSLLEQGISVESLLSKKVDLSSLKDMNVTLTANGQFYRRDKQGFMAELVEEMFADRKVFKKKMLEAEQDLQKTNDPEKIAHLKNEYSKYKNLQMAKKVSLNSLYGAFGSQFFRFYDIRNATAVTLTGQLSIRWIENRLNEFLNKILKTNGEDYVAALDTDSVYLLLDKLVLHSYKEKSGTVSTEEVINFLDRACETGIQPIIDRACADLGEYINVYQQKIFMKREALCDKAIWTGKKRYVLNVWDNEGVRYSKPKRKVTGLEMIKSSTPSSCRVKLKEALDIILDKDEAALQDFVSAYREEFKNLPLSEISFPRGCNGLTKYADKVTIYGKKTPAHVKGALFYNKLIQDNKLTKKYPLIANGDKLKYLPLKEPNPIRSDVLSFPQGGIPKEFGLDQYIDYEAQFQKSFVVPLNFILHKIGWEAEKSSTGSLLDFM